jgi:Protein of unknown function (DUF1501)
MLTLWSGKKNRLCDGISRRNFLQIGAFGAGLSLADMLKLRSSAAGSSSPKSAILIYLGGGPPHMDMYDMKPDAPAEIRGEFKPIQTNVPGVSICELFPLQARMWDKLAVIRSVSGTDRHDDIVVMTGYSDNSINASVKTKDYPSFGSVVSKLRSSQGVNVPQFISLRSWIRGLEPGYLGAAHRAFLPKSEGLDNMRLAEGVSVSCVQERKSLLASFDTMRGDLDRHGLMKGLDDLNARAFDVILSGTVHKALDLNNEPNRVRDRYKGIEQFLTARRLVEAGVGCVTLGYGGWDTHKGNFTTCRAQMPHLDRGIANLIQDLHDRGLEKDVVTVMWGEFGRTPKIGDGIPFPQGDGRGHWPPVMSALIAGGGLKMGQAIGATDAWAAYSRERPYSVQNVLSTIYRTIGIDPGQTLIDGNGRPRYLLDDREPVAELV